MWFLLTFCGTRVIVRVSCELVDVLIGGFFTQKDGDLQVSGSWLALIVNCWPSATYQT